MKRQTQTQTETIAPQRAVQEYLDGLLLDATTRARQEVPAPTVARPVIEPELAPVVTPRVLPKVVPKVVPVATPVVRAEVTPAPELEIAEDGWVDGRPAWAQGRFDCLLFRVAGLTLAVPLVELGGVLTIDQELTPLFGQPDWFLGLLPSKTDGTVKAIDTGRWVMPERYDSESRKDLKYVILMEDSEWGMACHEVADAISLEPDQVSWRSDRGKRPWLAGTVIEHMCAIMDVSALAKLVDTSSRGACINHR